MSTRRRRPAPQAAQPAPAPENPAAVLERLRRAWSRGGRAGGLKGGPKGGKARWKGTTAEERSANARKAARARWAKEK
jgi:hypothetical protein